MPSASLVSKAQPEPGKENAAYEAPKESTLEQALQVVEKKVRNLEKRKGKLDGYRADRDQGKELNGDQKSAIEKYEEVLQNLEFARELSVQFKQLANEDNKGKKKQLRKEQQERLKGELQKIATILDIQDFLRCMFSSKAKSDFLAGENGAVKLTKDQIAHLDEFSRLVRPSRRQHDGPEEFEETLSASADHLMSLVEGKPKKVLGNKTTYKELRESLDAIKACGYFDVKIVPAPAASSEAKSVEVANPGVDSEDGSKVSKEGPPSDGKKPSKKSPTHGNEGKPEKRKQRERGGRQQPDQEDRSSSSQQHGVEKDEDRTQHIQRQEKEASDSPQQPAAKADSDYVQPAVNGVVPQQQEQQFNSIQQQNGGSQFNFLQDSQIDMESPHMDPAVVVVQQAPPHHLGTHHPVSAAGNGVVPPVPSTVHQQIMAQAAVAQGLPNQIILTTPTTLAMQHAFGSPFQQQQQQVVNHQLQRDNETAQHQQQQTQQPHSEQPVDQVNEQEHPSKLPSPSPPPPQAPQPQEPQQREQPLKSPSPQPKEENQQDTPQPAGYAAIAAGGGFNREPEQDTMATIDDWQNVDANGNQDNGDGFQQGGGRRGGRFNGERRGRGGERGGYRGRGGNGWGRGGREGGYGGGRVSEGGRGARGGRKEFRGGPRGGDRGERGGYRGRGGMNGYHSEQRAH